MKSQTISKDKTREPARLTSGFTLIEVLLVLGLVALIAGVSFYFNMDSLRGYSFHADRDTLISALQHARAQAMNNVCRGSACSDGKPHGVFVDTANHKYVIFQTENANPDYAHRDSAYDAILDGSPAMIFEPGGLVEVVFSQLSGSVNTPGYIKIKDAGIHESQIDINSEGQIVWTN